MPSDFQIHSTPNPSEVMFSVRVSNLNMIKALESPGLLTRLTPYRNMTWIAQRPHVQEFGGYVYVAMEEADADHKRLIFAKSKTQTERNTPFETIYSTRQYPWPAVLQELWFEEVDNYIYQKRFYRPSVTVDSRIKIQHYLSEVPWPQAVTSHPQPIPTEVTGTQVVEASDNDVFSLQVNFPKCLHPEVILSRAIRSGSASRIDNAGTQPPNYTNSNPQSQVFPATNFTDWQKFVIQDVVQPQRGLYLREKVTIYPPQRIEAQQI
jgi:hypothetical protein